MLGRVVHEAAPGGTLPAGQRPSRSCPTCPTNLADLRKQGGAAPVPPDPRHAEQTPATEPTRAVPSTTVEKSRRWLASAERGTVRRGDMGRPWPRAFPRPNVAHGGSEMAETT
jgi:hypothetical protein